jgi:hypothetical protein
LYLMFNKDRFLIAPIPQCLAWMTKQLKEQ